MGRGTQEGQSELHVALRTAYVHFDTCGGWGVRQDHHGIGRPRIEEDAPALQPYREHGKDASHCSCVQSSTQGTGLENGQPSAMGTNLPPKGHFRKSARDVESS